ncbi:alpha/beta fold hydrolase [Nocardia takedensis]|uniref:alpha/beta fold hydrolase n=1 Tax=Nocardia takedensis TaxID=259390 RepID=UPI003F761AB0
MREHDRGRVYLMLHGGGGVPTMTGFAALLAERAHARVLLPTHPGFDSTPRAADLTDVSALANAYVALLDHLDLGEVTVIGNSFGGWLAAEIALLHHPRISAAVIVDGIGIVVEDHPMTDVRELSPAQLRSHSFHDPRKAPTPSSEFDGGPSPDVGTLLAYGGPTMSDPGLLARLTAIDIPVHVLWGASDRIVIPEYGKALADAIPTSSFTLLPDTGHLPQLETPKTLLDALTDLEQR